MLYCINETSIIEENNRDRNIKMGEGSSAHKTVDTFRADYALPATGLGIQIADVPAAMGSSTDTDRHPARFCR